MSDNYSAPEAKLHDEKLSRRKLGNCALAIISSIIFVPVMLYSLMLMTIGPQTTDFMGSRFLLFNTASALTAGMFVYPFRTWPWYLATLVAPFVDFIGLIVYAMLYDYIDL